MNKCIILSLFTIFILSCSGGEIKVIDDITPEPSDPLACRVDYTEGSISYTINCPGQDPVAIPLIPGTDGEDGTDGSDGLDGQDGSPGLPGSPGLDGEDGSNGMDGEDGEDGLDSILETIVPCPDIPGNQEVLFRLSTEVCNDLIGKCSNIFAVFVDGQKIFLTIVYPGEYNTTDGRKCTFTVTEDLEVTWKK